MNELSRDSDICVKCGLCLPHCPTYNKTGDENESPRGRIALIQAWASGHLTASEKLLSHIDNCLLCRSCERVCPAVVPYGRLVDNFRSLVKRKRRFILSTALLKRITRNKTLSRWTQSALGIYQTGVLQETARMFRLPQLLRLGEIDRLLPNAKGRLPITQTFFAAKGEVKGSVGLFTGCMGSLFDHETVAAAVQCLTVAGFDVYVPDRQSCCGALDQHEGDLKTAAQLAETNVRAFADHNLDAIVIIASGCGSQLMEYQNTEFAGKITDISQFLFRSGFDFTDKLKPLDASVCLHTPCSLKNVMRMEQGTFKLLQQIPGLLLTELPETIHCCGSAGAYMLEHPIMAKALASDVLAFAENTGARYLVTSNIGCSLHLAAGLREKGILMELIHPAALLARQLR